TDLPGTGDADCDRRRGLLPGGGGCATPRDGRLEEDRGARSVSRAAARGDARQGLSAGVRATHLPADARLRRIRLSAVARHELRAARIRLRLAQVLRARG